MNQPRRIPEALDLLERRFPGRLSRNPDIRRQHANTLTWIATEPPDAVLWPESTAEVVAIVEIAAAHRLPLIPFGAGTSLEGHVNAPQGGLALDVQHMDRILAVNESDLDCVVEPGVSRRKLNAHLRDTGLFFAVDPGAEEATIGGMASTRASGTTAVRYGTMRETVLNVTAVMADASVVRTAGRARKSAAGYDLTRLLVGSEGTLGIITELTVRLHGQPESIVAAVCPFPDVASACSTTIAAIQSGLALARIELLDALQIKAVNLHARLTLEELPTLFVELHGTPGATREQMALFQEIAADHGALRVQHAEGEDERRSLWKARHEAFWAIRSAWPGKAVLATDVCVPISRLADCVAETQADIARLGLTAPILGHVGDGNFHATPVLDPTDASERARVEELLARLADRAIAMGGTCTGEHGIGQGKMKHLAHEHGPGVAVMRAIKQALDPKDIFNPGKIFIP